MQWAQFVDHDITHTPVNRGFGDSSLSCKDCDAHQRIHPECLPISIPQGDPFYPQVNITSGKDFCLAFTRSMPGQLTLGFREQMNQITSFADASNVYGSALSSGFSSSPSPCPSSSTDSKTFLPTTRTGSGGMRC